MGALLAMEMLVTAEAERPPPRLTVVEGDPDADLVEAWRRGDRAAFAEIVRRHQRGLYALAHRYLRDDDESKDVVQLTFVRAFQALGDFRGGSQLRTWLYRIAVNGALNRLRDGKAQRKAPLEDALPEVEREAAEREREPRALTALVGAEAGAKLRAAVARLPEKQRLVLELRVYQDLPFKDVAVIAECSENSAKVNFHHAVKKLRQLLSNEVEHE